MTTHALRPEHANYEFVIPSDRRFAGRRVLRGYAYPRNGNVHNPTPRYGWLLLHDSRPICDFATRREMIEAVRADPEQLLL